MPKPLPCPFCGAEPEVLPIDPEVEGGCWGAVRCINPRCQAKPYVEDGATWAMDFHVDCYKEVAIRRWNRRKP